MRAQPRRRKESSSKGDEPVFLRKTYDMINSCDDDLACWSEKGDTFIIKNPDKFASEVIPTFFKHRKFSSFVRQLNFYGFRKVKSVSALESEGESRSQWWEFKHELFTKNTPNNLSEIKRATHYIATPEKEVDALKVEVGDLKSQISRMDDQIKNLTVLIDNMVIARQEDNLRQKRKNTGIEFYNPNEVNNLFSNVKPEFILEERVPPSNVNTEDSSEIDLLRTMSISSNSTTSGFFDSDLLEGLGLSSGLQFPDFDTALTTENEKTVKASDLPAEINRENDDAESLAKSIINLPPSLRQKLSEGIEALLNDSEEEDMDGKRSPTLPDLEVPEEDLPMARAALNVLLTQVSCIQRKREAPIQPLSGQIESLA